jgi:hypothetical protein
MAASAVDVLAHQLRQWHAAAPKDRKVASIHLFGIEHATALQSVNKHDVAERAGLSRSYGAELQKAAVLAEYVKIVKPLA